MEEVQETQARSLGWEDPVEEETATHSSTLAWRIPMDRGGHCSPCGPKDRETVRAAVHVVLKTGRQ